MRSCPAPCTEPGKGFPFLVIPSPPGRHRSLSKHLRLWLPSISHAAIQPTILGHSPSSSPLCLTQLKRLFHGPSLVCVIRCRNSWASPTASGLSRPFPHHSASLALCFRQPQVLVAFLPRLSLSFAHGTVPLKMPFPRDFYPPSVHLNISSLSSASSTSALTPKLKEHLLPINRQSILKGLFDLINSKMPWIERQKQKQKKCFLKSIKQTCSDTNLFYTFHLCRSYCVLFWTIFWAWPLAGQLCAHQTWHRAEMVFICAHKTIYPHKHEKLIVGMSKHFWLQELLYRYSIY